MSGLREFLAMGGYGAFVWPSYLVVLAVLVVLGGLSWRTFRAANDEADRLKRSLGRGQSNHEA